MTPAPRPPSPVPVYPAPLAYTSYELKQCENCPGLFMRPLQSGMRYCPRCTGTHLGLKPSEMETLVEQERAAAAQAKLAKPAAVLPLPAPVARKRRSPGQALATWRAQVVAAFAQRGELTAADIAELTGCARPHEVVCQLRLAGVDIQKAGSVPRPAGSMGQPRCIYRLGPAPAPAAAPTVVPVPAAAAIAVPVPSAPPAIRAHGRGYLPPERAKYRNWGGPALPPTEVHLAPLPGMPAFEPRQLQVIERLLHGQRNKQIAAEMGWTEQMVKNTLSRVYDLTGQDNRLSFVVWWKVQEALAARAAPAAPATRGAQ